MDWGETAVLTFTLSPEDAREVEEGRYFGIYMSNFIGIALNALLYLHICPTDISFAACRRPHTVTHYFDIRYFLFLTGRYVKWFLDI